MYPKYSEEIIEKQKRDILYPKIKAQYQNMSEEGFNKAYNNAINGNIGSTLDDLASKSSFLSGAQKTINTGAGLIADGVAWLSGDRDGVERISNAGKRISPKEGMLYNPKLSQKAKRAKEILDQRNRNLKVNQALQRGDSMLSDLAFGLGEMATNPLTYAPIGTLAKGANGAYHLGKSALSVGAGGGIGGALDAAIDKDKSVKQVGVQAALGGAFGGVLGTGVAGGLNKFAGRSFLGNTPHPNTAPTQTLSDPHIYPQSPTQPSQSVQPQAQPSMTPMNAEDQIANQILKAMELDPKPNMQHMQPNPNPSIMYSQKPQWDMVGDNFVSNFSEAPTTSYERKFSIQDYIKNTAGINPNAEIMGDLEKLAHKHPEMFKNPKDAHKLLREMIYEPTHFYPNNNPNVALMGKMLENGKLGKIGIEKNNPSGINEIKHLTQSSKSLREHNRLLARGENYPLVESAPHSTQSAFNARPTPGTNVLSKNNSNPTTSHLKNALIDPISNPLSKEAQILNFLKQHYPTLYEAQGLQPKNQSIMFTNPAKSNLNDNLTPQQIHSVISKWDLSAPSNDKLLVSKISEQELQQLNKDFSFKGNYAIAREIDKNHLRHVINRHTNSNIETSRNQIPITLEYIANYENIIKTSDIREVQGNKIIYKKQINGHYVVIEEALTGRNKLEFVTMWKSKGNITPSPTPSSSLNGYDLDRTLSAGYNPNPTTSTLKNTLDDDFMYSKNREAKELRGIYNVTYNDKNATPIYKDIQKVEEAIAYTKGYHDSQKGKGKGLGAEHIQIRHLNDKTKPGFVTDSELVSLGKNMREYIKKHEEPFIDQRGGKIYEWENTEGVRFRLIVDKTAEGAGSNIYPASDEQIISFYSDRNLNARMQFKNPKLNIAYSVSEPISEKEQALKFIKQNHPAVYQGLQAKQAEKIKSQELLMKLASNLKGNTLGDIGAGVLGGSANTILNDDPNTSTVEKFAAGFALGFAGKRASQYAYGFAKQSFKDFKDFAKDNPQLFTRMLHAQALKNLSQFGGEKALKQPSLSFRVHNLSMAKALEKQGFSSEVIMHMSGWYKLKDGKYRFVFDHKNAKSYHLKEGDYRLIQVLKSEELYKAYPFLKDLPITLKPLRQDTEGFYDPKIGEYGAITLNKNLQGEAFNKALAHEIQHAIQTFEGFATGSKPKGNSLEDFKAYQNSLGELEARMTDKTLQTDFLNKLENANYNKEGDSWVGMSQELRTYYTLKKYNVKDLHKASEQEFRQFVDDMHSGNIERFKKAPNIMHIEDLNPSLAKALGIENNQIYFTKNALGHVRPDRKDKYNQGLRPEEFLQIQSEIRNAKKAYIDTKNQNFFLTFEDKMNKNKLNYIHLNKDELGNYMVTIKKAERRVANHYKTVSAEGLAPTIPQGVNQNSQVPSTTLTASTDTINPNPTTSTLKNTLDDDFIMYSKRFLDEDMDFDPERRTSTAGKLIEGLKVLQEKSFKQNLSDFTSWIRNHEMSHTLLGTRIYTERYKAYRDLRSQLESDISVSNAKAVQLHHSLMELSPETRKEMYRYMVGDSLGENLSPGVKHLSDVYRAEIDKLGDELVKAGLLSEKTRKKWGSVYMMRQYSPKLLDRIENFLQGGSVDPSGLGIGKKHLRGKQIKVSEKELQGMQKRGLIGSVREGKWEILSSHKEGHTLRRDFTQSERMRLREQTDIAYALPQTLQKIQSDLSMAKLFESVSKQGSYVIKKDKSMPYAPPGYKELKGYEFGALRGFYVKKEVADDIENTTQKIIGEASKLKDSYFKLVTYWKKTHTVYNPSSHINNLIGNIAMLGIEGDFKAISYIKGGMQIALKIDEYEKLLAIGRIKALDPTQSARFKALDSEDMRLYKRLKDQGVFGSNKLNAVLNEFLLSKNKIQQSHSKITQALKKVDGMMSDAYALEDSAPRFALIKSLMQRGHKLDQAVEIASKTLPDYSKPMPKWMNASSRYGIIPFIQFSYHSTPIMIRQLTSLKNHAGENVAIKKLGVLAGVLRGYNALSLAVTGELPLSENHSPKGFGMKELPFYRNGDNVHTLRIASMLPHNALPELLPFTGKGAVPEALRQMALGGVPQEMMGLLLNKDWNYDRPITNKGGALGAYQIGKRAMQNYTPDGVDKIYNTLESLILSQEQRRRSKVIQERNALEQLINLLGLNVKPYNQAELKRENDRKKNLH